MCIHVQRKGPVSKMKDLCMSIPEDKRILLAALIKLFSQVCINLQVMYNYLFMLFVIFQIVKRSEKNHTDIATLNKQFGEYVFENCPSGNSESLLAYMINSYELVLS